MHKIITISREFGSGGRELGKRLAEELGIPCYDHQIIEMIARRTALTSGMWPMCPRRASRPPTP